MSPRILIASAALACASALALPGAAGAAVVQVLGDDLRIDGFTGATNRIDVRYTASGQGSGGTVGPRLLVDDTAGITVLGTGCTRVSAESASCDAQIVRSISAGLTDGDDVLVVSTDGAEAVPATYPATIRGGVGNDVIKTGNADDELGGGAGRDILAGGVGDDELAGGAGADGLIGFEGDDVLSGAAGKDALFGQKGRDDLKGGAGNDVLLARDGKRDRRIDCGPGSRERAVRDRVDPPARSCSPTKGQGAKKAA